MPLQTNNIKGTGGEIYAHVFENRFTGVPRGLYWNVSLNCTPVVLDGVEWPCGIACEWLQWPIGSWEQLDGMKLQNCKRRDFIQCSFYFADHHPLKLAKLELRRASSERSFLAHLSGCFDLNGFGELDGKDIPVQLWCEAEFAGVIVVPENLFPKPATDEEASAVVRQLISVERLAPPRWDRFRYVFEPR